MSRKSWWIKIRKTKLLRTETSSTSQPWPSPSKASPSLLLRLFISSWSVVCDRENRHMPWMYNNNTTIWPHGYYLLYTGAHDSTPWPTDTLTGHFIIPIFSPSPLGMNYNKQKTTPIERSTEDEPQWPYDISGYPIKNTSHLFHSFHRFFPEEKGSGH